MDRRQFLKTATVVSAGVASGVLMGDFAGTGSEARAENGMIYRTLGRADEKVSVIGLGGFHVGSVPDDTEAIRIIRRALDNGINFLDNCWSYHHGRSEELMGRALADGYRRKAFVMSKIDGRTKEATARQIDESLRRLKTGHIDLMQFHEIIRMEDGDRIFNEGGMEAMLAAKMAGKVRHIGFTGHKDPLVHLRMLEVARDHSFIFDAVQMPLNVMDAHFRSFSRDVLPTLVRDGIGVLAMKPFAEGAILRAGVVKPVECLHYAMNLPVSTVITGIDSMKILDQALEAVKTFRPLTSAQVYDILARTAESAASGKYEPFKTGNHYDSTARNPEWLG